MSKTNELKTQLAQAGIDITGSDVSRGIRKARNRARIEADKKFTASTFKVAVAQRIQTALSWLATMFSVVFLVAGTMALVILFPLAEYHAVRNGLLLVTHDGLLSTLNATVIVLGLDTLLFLKFMYMDNLPGAVPQRTLSTLVSKVTWYFGYGDMPEAVDKRVALYSAVSGAVMLLKVVILMLGILGRLGADLLHGNVLQFIGGLVGAEVYVLIGLIGTALLTYALIQTTNATVLFIYTVFRSFVGVLSLDTSTDGGYADFLAERSEELTIEYLNDLLIQARSQNDSTQ